MPTLEWIGKDKVINHHQEVPYRILDKKYTYNAESSENMIIHGDNLLALKSLLPQYEGKVDCIYIDPPYNTGNEKWVYNDNVNDPKIKKWLGEVVGAEGEDLSRHDKWLCMMYPRLKLLCKLLAEDGVIFISIDDSEYSNLKLICDEIFGSYNFLADIIWKHTQQSKNDEPYFARMYNHTLCYAKSVKQLGDFYFERTEDDNKNYSNPDGDPKGLWRSGDVRSPSLRETLKYNIISPNGVVIPPPENGWRWSKEAVQQKIATGEIIFKPDESGIVRKIYLCDQKGRTPENLWAGEKYGTTRMANALLKSIFDNEVPFDTPKPIELIERIIELTHKSNVLILDSFAGSGTTAHAVLNLNKQDNGNRKFILVEMMDYADTITAERIKRVIDGYGEGSKAVDGLGGDFSYYELGEPLFREDKNLNEDVGEEEIRKYVYYMETKKPLEENAADNRYYMGKNNDTAYYFYYEKDKPTTLNREFLSTVETKASGYIIYADICTLSKETFDWLKNKTQSTSKEACEVVIAFFVQNCEVFDEITK